VNIQSTGSDAGVFLDQAQTVSSAPIVFHSQSVTISGNESLNAVLTDLQVPATLDNPLFVVSRGSQVLGTVAAGATLTFSATPGIYQLSAIAANPTTSQPFGMVATALSLTPPNAILTSNASSVAAGGTVTLSWTSTQATSCYLQGGSLENDVALSGSESVSVPSTTTYTLTCSGQNDLMVSVSVTVTATTTASGGGGGGGSIDSVWLLIATGLCIGRLARHGPPRNWRQRRAI
jgi:hypothetical protein